MKIAKIVSSLDPALGGVVEAVNSISNVQQNLGHEIDIVSMDDSQSPWMVSDSGIRKIGLGPGRFGINYTSAAGEWMRQNLSKYDILVVEGLWQYHSFCTWSNCRKLGYRIPYLVMPHGMLDPYFQRLDVRPIKSFRNSIYWHFLERQVVRNASAMLFTSEEERLLASKTFWRYTPKRTEVVGLGISKPPERNVDAEEAFRSKVRIPSGRRYLVFLGRIHPKKGIDLLLKAYAMLHRELQSSRNATADLPMLVIIGPCDNAGYLKNLQDLAEHSGIAKSIVWAGMMAGESKWNALYCSEGMVLSSHQENFGISVVEAMACARPVLISNKVNIWREIQQDGAGVVCDDTVEGVVAALRNWLAMSKDEIVDRGAAALRSFESRFSLSSAAEKMLEVAASVIEEKKCGGRHDR